MLISIDSGAGSIQFYFCAPGNERIETSNSSLALESWNTANKSGHLLVVLPGCFVMYAAYTNCDPLHACAQLVYASERTERPTLVGEGACSLIGIRQEEEQQLSLDTQLAD